MLRTNIKSPSGKILALWGRILHHLVVRRAFAVPNHAACEPNGQRICSEAGDPSSHGAGGQPSRFSRNSRRQLVASFLPGRPALTLSQAVIAPGRARPSAPAAPARTR